MYSICSVYIILSNTCIDGACYTLLVETNSVNVCEVSLEPAVPA
jgi:hypothetical protein